MENFDYTGDELDVFALAKNWKNYWSNEIQDFIGENVLEVGAGIGSTATALADRKKYLKWLAVEPDERLCSTLLDSTDPSQLPENFSLVCGDSGSIDESLKFDTVLYIDVLEHIEDDVGELRRVQKKLVDGGRIIIVAPAHNFLFTPFDKKIGHFRRYDKTMLRQLIPTELHIKKLRYLDSIGFFASLANRALIRTDSPSASQVGFWDRFMVRASRLADPLIRYQLGKSIVCILEKPIDSPRM